MVPLLIDVVLNVMLPICAEGWCCVVITSVKLVLWCTCVLLCGASIRGCCSLFNVARPFETLILYNNSQHQYYIIMRVRMLPR